MRRPAQLLLELADRLRAQGPGDGSERRYQNLRLRAEEVHRQQATEARFDPDALLDRPDFLAARRAFVALIESLERPVVLILDTCEELLKLQPIDGRMPAVEMTFRILESVHEDLPGMRVIFAGRRLLAQSGLGWEDAGTEGDDLWARPRSVVPYLRLHKIRGFTEAEAGEYFDRLDDVVLTERLRRRTILSRSLEPGEGPAVKQTGAAPVDPGPRYNPFDLKLYADWVREDPGLDPAIIGSGELDPYVEVRILRRINDDRVRRAIPGAVWLRQFDREMIRPLVRDPALTATAYDAALERVYRILGEQEWTDYRIGEQSNQSYLVVSPLLRDRLERYFGHESRAEEWADALQELLPSLGGVAAVRSLVDLDATRLDAALRLLPSSEAAGLWDGIARRVPAEAGWAWAFQTTSALLGDDGAVDRRTRPLRAGVVAVYTSALLHEYPDNFPERFACWTEVGETAKDYPDPETGAFLDRLALAGRVAAIGASRAADLAGDLYRLFRMLDGLPDRSDPPEAPARAPSRLGPYGKDWEETSESPGGRPPPRRLSAARRPWNEAVPGTGPRRDEAEQIAAGLCAAVEALISPGAAPLIARLADMEASKVSHRFAVVDVSKMILDLDDRLARFADVARRAGVSQNVRSFIECLRLRVCMWLAGRDGPASDGKVVRREILERVRATGHAALQTDSRPYRASLWWAWRAPDSLDDYLDLEADFHARVLDPDRQEDLRPSTAPGRDFRDVDPTGRPLGGPKPAYSNESIDSERYASWRLLRGLAEGLCPIQALEDTAAAERYSPLRRPSRPVHREVPPLFSSLARGWVAVGRGDRALELLQRRRTEALAASDELTFEDTVRAEIEVASRLRLDAVGEAGAGSTRAADIVRSTWARDLLVGWPRRESAPPPSSSPADRHAYWRCTAMLKPEPAEEALDWIRLWPEEAVLPGQEFDTYSCLIDRYEAARFAVTQLDGPGGDTDGKAYAVRWDHRFPRERFTGLDSWPIHRPSDLEDSLRVRLRLEALDPAGDRWGVAAWSRRVGIRRSAELALEEGELLAARLPDRATALLERAHGWFRQANDPLGSTIAATRWMIALLHSGGREPLRNATLKVKPELKKDYADLLDSGQVPDLPSWDGLASVAWRTGPFNYTPLGGWLARIAVALAYADDPKGTGPHAGLVKERLESRYGGRTPVELDLFQATYAPRTEGVGWTIALGLLGLLLVAISAGIAIGIWNAALYLMRVAEMAILRSSATSDIAVLGTRLDTLNAIGLGVLVLLAAFFYRFLPSLLTSRAVLSLAIEPSADAPPQPDPARVLRSGIIMRLRKWAFRKTWPWNPELRAAEVTSGEWATPGLRPYRAAAEGLPAAVKSGLAGLRRRLSRDRLSVALLVNPRVAESAWEAILNLAVPPSRRYSWADFPYRGERAWERLQFFRAGQPGAGSDVAAGDSWTSGGVRAIAGPTHRDVLARSPGGPAIEFSSGEPEGLAEGKGRLLIVVGKPVRTSDGYWINVESAGGTDPTTYRSSSGRDLRSKPSTPDVGGSLIDPRPSRWGVSP